MRLLKHMQNGSFHLSAFADGSIPPYAILSHTWGRGGHDEVTYKDIVGGTGKNKEGLKKLQFCSEQAREHGLDYFWVDTCCIDKSSSSELTEAINSMFHWYQRAERCYVYLTDVSVRTQDGQLPHVEWASALRNSRWFTRGWTLQELLAPRRVEFYSRDGFRLGDKISLLESIHEVTGIHKRRFADATCSSSASRSESAGPQAGRLPRRRTWRMHCSEFALLLAKGTLREFSILPGDGVTTMVTGVRRTIYKSFLKLEEAEEEYMRASGKEKYTMEFDGSYKAKV